jgi:hypothetical protein
MAENMSRRGLFSLLGSLAGWAATWQATTGASAAAAGPRTKRPVIRALSGVPADVLGRVTTYTYYSGGQLIAGIRPKETLFTYIYDAQGQRVLPPPPAQQG